MKLKHVALLSGASVQTAYGQVSGTFTGPDWDLFFLTRLGLVELKHKYWDGPAYVPVSICSMTPEEPLRRS